MSSTFVTRLKVGEILVDAKGVSRLVSRGIGVWPLVALVAGTGWRPIVVAVAASPALRNADRVADRAIATASASSALRRLVDNCGRVRPPLPRRVAGGRLPDARRRHPRRRRHLRAGLRGRRRARPPQRPDRRASRSRSTPRTRRPRTRAAPAGGARTSSRAPTRCSPTGGSTGSGSSSLVVGSVGPTLGRSSSARCATAMRSADPDARAQRAAPTRRDRVDAARGDRVRRLRRRAPTSATSAAISAGSSSSGGADAALGRALERPRRGASGATREPADGVVVDPRRRAAAGADVAVSSPGSTRGLGSTRRARRSASRRRASSRARSRSSSATASRPWTAIDTRARAGSRSCSSSAGATPGQLRHPRHGRRRDPAADRAAAQWLTAVAERLTVLVAARDEEERIGDDGRGAARGSSRTRRDRRRRRRLARRDGRGAPRQRAPASSACPRRGKGQALTLAERAVPAGRAAALRRRPARRPARRSSTATRDLADRGLRPARGRRVRAREGASRARSSGSRPAATHARAALRPARALARGARAPASRSRPASASRRG